MKSNNDRGYISPAYNGAIKRYEIPKGIREAGILNMEIYLLGNRLFMIVETPVDFNWDEAFGRLAKMEKQAEWEAFVDKFQQSEAGAASSEKWQRMEQIFQLP